MTVSDTMSFVDAAHFQGRVKGATHDIYKYPARFSPIFARTAIERFTSVGNTVLDPFVGGGTSLIEANLLGRNAFGSDISSLAVFLTKSKTVPLSEVDIKEIDKWFSLALKRMNIHRNSRVGIGTEFDGYDRNMPWQIRKLCEQFMEKIESLPSARQKRFVRCVLLRCGQWALDCRKSIPTTDEFRESLLKFYNRAIEAMRDYRKSLNQIRRKSSSTLACRCVQSSAAKLSKESFGKSLKSNVDLVLTSPPYPGVHVLYHRWNVRARRETPAPFWLANCQDGQGDAFYTLGGRREEKLPKYFNGIRESFGNLKGLMKKSGLVVQLVGFSENAWQLEAFNTAMSDAGYSEVMPAHLGIECAGRLWRSVPGRRWYSAIRGDIPSSREVVLFHKPT